MVDCSCDGGNCEKCNFFELASKIAEERLKKYETETGTKNNVVYISDEIGH